MRNSPEREMSKALSGLPVIATRIEGREAERKWNGGGAENFPLPFSGTPVQSKHTPRGSAIDRLRFEFELETIIWYAFLSIYYVYKGQPIG